MVLVQGQTHRPLASTYFLFHQVDLGARQVCTTKCGMAPEGRLFALSSHIAQW